MVVKTTVPAAAKTGRVVGAPSATAPMLLDLKRWGVQQCLWLPGQAGNYASVPDANMLDADTAHVEQSEGRWMAPTNLVSSTGRTVTFPSNEQTHFGNNSLKVESTGQANNVGVGGDAFADVAASTTYSLGVWVHATLGVEMFLRVRNVGGTTNPNPNVSFVGTGDWQFVESPSFTTAGTNPQLDVAVRISATEAATFFIGAACLRQGADPTFVPSHRIVGDLDLRAKVALADWSTQPSYATLMSKFDDGQENWIWRQPSNDIAMEFLAYSDGGVENFRSAALADGRQVRDLRLTFETDISQVTFIEDGQQLGSQVTNPPISLAATSAPIRIGMYRTTSGELRSAILAFEIRDGIDGPVVASADFTDLNEVTGDNWTTPEGHAASIYRSAGNATAELVNRNCWAFTGEGVIDLSSVSVRPEDFTLFVMFANRADFISWYGVLQASSMGLRVRGNQPYEMYFRVEDIEGDIVQAYANGLVHSEVMRGYTLVWNNELKRMDAYTNDGAHVAATNQNVDVPEIDAELFLGGSSLSSGGFIPGGFIPLGLILERTITDQERAQLAAWDGSVDQEPSWLRGDPDLVLYLNADDPLTAVNYANGDVVDLKGVTHPKNYTKVPLRT